MRIRIGYSLTFELAQATPMIVVLNVHHSRSSDLLSPDAMITLPPTPYTSYRDAFGNWCNRVTAPAGTFQIRADTRISDPGTPDEVASGARQIVVEDLPDDALMYLLPSRYVDSGLPAIAARALSLRCKSSGTCRTWIIVGMLKT